MSDYEDNYDYDGEDVEDEEDENGVFIIDKFHKFFYSHFLFSANFSFFI